MRHDNGNCLVAGGFCTSVSDSICEALHSAYDCGKRSINPEDLRPHGKWEPYYEDVEIYNTGGFTRREQTGWICGRCKSGDSFTDYKRNFCTNCGAKMEE